MVRKSFGRLIENEWKDGNYINYNEYELNQVKQVEKDVELKQELDKIDKMNDRERIRYFTKISEKNDLYKNKVSYSTFVPQLIGNCYSASIFFGLLSLIDGKGIDLIGKKIGIFSYGSGVCASLYCLTVTHNNIKYCSNQLKKIQIKSNLIERLNSRIERSPEYFNQTLDKRAQEYAESHISRSHDHDHNGSDHDNSNCIQFTPCDERLFQNSFYLSQINSNKERIYSIYHGVSKDKKEEKEKETVKDESKIGDNLYRARKIVSNLIVELENKQNKQSKQSKQSKDSQGKENTDNRDNKDNKESKDVEDSIKLNANSVGKFVESLARDRRGGGTQIDTQAVVTIACQAQKVAQKATKCYL